MAPRGSPSLDNRGAGTLTFHMPATSDRHRRRERCEKPTCSEVWEGTEGREERVTAAPPSVPTGRGFQQKSLFGSPWWRGEGGQAIPVFLSPLPLLCHHQSQPQRPHPCLPPSQASLPGGPTVM